MIERLKGYIRQDIARISSDDIFVTILATLFAMVVLLSSLLVG